MIERSTDPAGGYLPLGTIPGRGTTSDPQSYTYTDVSLPGAGVYYYRLAETDLSGNTSYHGPVSVVYNRIGIAEFFAGPACPNPTSGPVSISCQLPSPGRITAAIYNAIGQRVKTLVDQDRGTFSWDGRDERGGNASGGIYFFRLTFRADAALNERTVNKRFVLTR